MSSADQIDENDKLWSDFLKQVRENSCNQVSQKRSILLLGNSRSGKSSLVARLKGTAEVPNGSGIEYHYVDIKEGRNEHMKLSVWVCDGEERLSYLLENSGALTDFNFADTLAVLCVSLDEPWSIIDSIKNWTRILESQIQKLNISPSVLAEYKESLVRHFYAYVEPDLETNSRVGISLSLSAHTGLSQLTEKDKTIENPLHPSLNMLQSVYLPNGTGDLSDDEDSTSAPKNEDQPLKHNLGMPLVVVLTKIDCMPHLRKELCLSDEHFDFLQLHLRRFCLSYGASLIYTSVHEDKNCDILNRYLRHRIFGFPFQHSAYIVEADSVFVPTGWDNGRKIQILCQNLVNIHPDRAFSDVFNDVGHCPSSAITGTNQLPAEVSAMDEQVLLNRMATLLVANNTSNVNQSVPVTAVNPQQPVPNVSLNQSQPVSASSRNSGKRVGENISTNVGSASAAAAASIASNSAASNAAATGSATASNERVLTTFFNSLLNKQRNPPTNSTSPNPPNE